MAEKVLTHSGGNLTEMSIGIATSAGAGDAGKVVALDGAGRIATAQMPAGIGAQTKDYQATEAISAGALVNVYDVSGNFRIRNADATVVGKKANGYVLAGIASAATGTVYLAGINNQLTGLAPGDLYLSAATPGAVTATPPTGTGKIVQRVGYALSVTEALIELDSPIVLA